MIKKFANAFKWTTLGNLFTTVINIFVPLYLAFYIPPEDFGKLAIVTVVYNVLNMIFRPAFGEARIQKDDMFESKKIDDVIFTINILKMLFIVALLYLSIDILNSYYKVRIDYLIYILLGVNFIGAFRSPRMYLLAKNLEFKKSNLLESSAILVGGIVSLSLAFFTKEITSVVYGMLVTAFFRTILSQIYTPYVYKLSFDFSKLKGIFSFGFLVMLERLFTSIGQNIDRILLSIFLDLHWLGIYQMAKTISYKVFELLANIFNSILFPVVSKNIKEKNFEYITINTYLYILLGIGILFNVVLHLLLPEFIPFLGKNWTESLKFLDILLLGSLLFYISSTILIGFIKAFGDAKTTMINQVYKIILLTIATYLLGSIYGIYGILSALILVEFFSLVYSIFKLQKYVPINYKFYTFLAVSIIINGVYIVL